MDDLAWLPASTTSVTLMRPGQIALLETFGGALGGRGAACWREIERGVRAGYQIQMEVGRSFHAMHAPVDRDAVERCVESAFPRGHLLHARKVRDGEVTRFDTDGLGTAVLWWRGGGWVIVGTAEQVAGARAATGSLASSPCMSRLLPELPATPIALARCDAFFDNVLGVPTHGWLLGIAVERDVGMDGQVTVLYASPAEAVKAAGVMTSRSFPALVPPPIRDFLGGLPALTEGARLNIGIHMTRADLDKVDVAALQKMAENFKANQAAP